MVLLILLDIPKKKYQYAGKTGTAQVKRITEAEREADLRLEQIKKLLKEVIDRHSDREKYKQNELTKT